MWVTRKKIKRKLFQWLWDFSQAYDEGKVLITKIVSDRKTSPLSYFFIIDEKLNIGRCLERSNIQGWLKGFFYDGPEKKEILLKNNIEKALRNWVFLKKDWRRTVGT